MISTRFTAASAAALAVAACATMPADTMNEAVELPEQFQGVEIVTTALGDGLYMLVGQGGNIGLSVGEDGAFMIDDQYAPLTPLIEAAVAEVNGGAGDVRFIVNTHYHGDHAGGNEAWGGKGATIVAHDNVRERLSQPVVPPGSSDDSIPGPLAWPVITFAGGLTFHLNGETAEVIHVAHAHTDGDAIIHFVEPDVLHMGDTFFNGFFPFIDLAGGGSVEGYLGAVDAGLSIADEDTKIIPGHGPLATREDLEIFRTMLSGVLSAVRPLAEQGMSVEEIVAANPLAAYDAQWGQGFMNTETFTTIVATDLTSGM